MHLNSAGKERRIGFGKVTAVRDILAVFHSLIRETDEELLTGPGCGLPPPRSNVTYAALQQCSTLHAECRAKGIDDRNVSFDDFKV